MYLNFFRLSTFSGAAVANRRCISARGTDTNFESASENALGVGMDFSSMPTTLPLAQKYEHWHTESAYDGTPFGIEQSAVMSPPINRKRGMIHHHRPLGITLGSGQSPRR